MVWCRCCFEEICEQDGVRCSSCLTITHQDCYDSTVKCCVVCADQIHDTDNTGMVKMDCYNP